jgi:hypothetical protein
MITKEYAAQLAIEHQSNKNWGGSTNKYGSGDILGLITTRPYVRSVLDYGCGKGELAKYLKPHVPDIPVTEYDPGIPGKDTPPTGTFDLVVTCDVLEHVEPEFIDATIDRLFGLCRFVMYNNIACAPDLHPFTGGPYLGKDRHLIQEPPLAWKERFERVITDPKISLMEYRSIERRHKTGLRGRCVMIHERLG